MAKGKERKVGKGAYVCLGCSDCCRSIGDVSISYARGPLSKNDLYRDWSWDRSAGIGFTGVWIIVKSDGKMRAIAKREFDEKGAIM